MPRHFVLKFRKTIRRGKTCFEVRVPAELQAAEGKRRFFDREAVARTFVDKCKRILAHYSDKARGLSDAEKIEATEAIERCREHGKTLREAVDVAERIWITIMPCGTRRTC